jgi:hypothetical protein
LALTACGAQLVQTRRSEGFGGLGEGVVAPILKDWRTIIANDWNTLLCLFFIVNIVPAAVLFPVCVTKQNFFATRWVQLPRVVGSV